MLNAQGCGSGLETRPKSVMTAYDGFYALSLKVGASSIPRNVLEAPTSLVGNICDILYEINLLDVNQDV